jgi:uncharacterized LabA/DUF88 family protein
MIDRSGALDIVVQNVETSVASRHGKIALFIDGPNLHATGQALGFRVDFRRLLEQFQGMGAVVRAFYYTTIAEADDFVSIRPLLDWLDYNGYAVVTKPAKELVLRGGDRTIKGNMDVELAVNAMELAPSVDQAILFSGDSSFCPLVVALQRRGVRVSVVSSVATDPPMAASELRRQADAFVDLKNLKAQVNRS